MPQTMTAAEFLARQPQRRKGAKKASESDKLRRAFPAFHQWAQRQTITTGVLWFPMPPNLAQLDWHWSEKNEAKETYRTQLDSLRMQRLLPCPVTCFSRAKISAMLYLPQAMDQDNSLARLKWTVDWMVRAGYLKDDNPDCLRWASVPHQEKSGKTPPRVRLEVREWR